MFHEFMKKSAKQRLLQQQQAGGVSYMSNSKSYKVKAAELQQICDALETHFDRQKQKGCECSASTIPHPAPSTAGLTLWLTRAPAPHLVSMAVNALKIPMVTAQQMRKLAENIQLDDASVSEMLYRRLDKLVLFPDREWERIMSNRAATTSDSLDLSDSLSSSSRLGYSRNSDMTNHPEKIKEEPDEHSDASSVDDGEEVLSWNIPLEGEEDEGDGEEVLSWNIPLEGEEDEGKEKEKEELQAELALAVPLVEPVAPLAEPPGPAVVSVVPLSVDVRSRDTEAIQTAKEDLPQVRCMCAIV
jgi:hypothetical protein